MFTKCSSRDAIYFMRESTFTLSFRELAKGREVEFKSFPRVLVIVLTLFLTQFEPHEPFEQFAGEKVKY